MILSLAIQVYPALKGKAKSKERQEKIAAGSDLVVAYLLTEGRPLRDRSYR
jgi:hypothetical protein